MATRKKSLTRVRKGPRREHAKEPFFFKPDLELKGEMLLSEFLKLHGDKMVEVCIDKAEDYFLHYNHNGEEHYD